MNPQPLALKIPYVGNLTMTAMETWKIVPTIIIYKENSIEMKNWGKFWFKKKIQLKLKFVKNETKQSDLKEH